MAQNSWILLAGSLALVGCEGVLDISERQIPQARTDIEEVRVFVSRSNFTVSEGRSVEVQFSGHHTVGRKIQFRTTRLPEGAMFLEDEQKIIWTPGKFQGDPASTVALGKDYQFELIGGVRSATGVFLEDRARVSIFVKNVNQAPVAAWDGRTDDIVMEALQRKRLYFTVSDPDFNPDLAEVAFEHKGPSGVRFNFDMEEAGIWVGRFDWTPSAYDVGTHTVHFNFRDHYGARTEINRRIQVLPANRRPTQVTPREISVRAGTILKLSLAANDLDGDRLSINLRSRLTQRMKYERWTQQFTWDIPRWRAEQTFPLRFKIREVERSTSPVMGQTLIHVGAAINRRPEVRPDYNKLNVIVGQKAIIPVEVTDPDRDRVVLECHGDCPAEVKFLDRGLEWSPQAETEIEFSIHGREIESGLTSFPVKLNLKSFNRLDQAVVIADSTDANDRIRTQLFIRQIFGQRIARGTTWINPMSRTILPIDIKRRKWLILIDRYDQLSRPRIQISNIMRNAIRVASDSGTHIFAMGSNVADWIASDSVMRKLFHVNRARYTIPEFNQKFLLRWPAQHVGSIDVHPEVCFLTFSCAAFVRDRGYRNSDQVEEWLELDTGSKKELIGIRIQTPSGTKRILMGIDPYLQSEATVQQKWKDIIDALLF